VAESMGIHRQDKFKQYAQWNNLEQILNDLGPNIETSPFSEEQIIAALQSVFLS
jgi:hypothetical protein